MKTALLIIAALLLIGSAASFAADTPAWQIVKLKQQLRAKNAIIEDKNETIGSLRTERDAQDVVISDQIDTIQRLRNRIANTPEPLDAILARDPDGLWQAMRAIWLAFPTLDEGAICGYDRSYVPGDGEGLTLTSFTFYAWRGC